MDKQKEVYKEEAHELLAELETALLELEEKPDNQELVGRVFRALHTIKGSGAMVGFDEIAEFTHELETVFDLVREGKIPVTRHLINLVLSARDMIKLMLDTGGDISDADVQKAKSRIVAEFQKLIPEEFLKTHKYLEKKIFSPISDITAQNITYRIRFSPAENIFDNGTNPIFLLDELRRMGDCMILAQTDDIPLLDALEPEKSYFCWDVILTTRNDINVIRDVFIFVEDKCTLKIEIIDDEVCTDNEYDYKKLGEILLERNDLTCDDLKKVLKNQKRIGELLVEKNVIARGKVESALMEQQKIREIRKNRQEAATYSSIRVPSEKLDVLVNLVGELLTAQARLSRVASLHDEYELFGILEADSESPVYHDNAELVAVAEEIARITSELRNTSMNIRMLPISTLFNKFRRMIRDLSAELGKEVAMTISGGETELDKTIIERLNDPLMHIIRNAIDHGIEPPEVREKSGKPRQGTLSLSAMHAGPNVLIRVSGDGAGMDTDAIWKKAVEKGLISPDMELTTEEIHNLIFVPGFSTAKKVTDVSGRGVGLDVVRRAIEALGGSIEITSKKNAGTTVILNLPLTLVIVDGLLVKVEDSYFVFPLSVVEECMELSAEMAAKARERHMIRFRDKIISYLSLREQFQLGEKPEAAEQVVIADADGCKLAFGVDHVIGNHQTVIKSLGSVYRDIKGLSGATILGDGTVALILDVHQLIAACEKKEKERV